MPRRRQLFPANVFKKYSFPLALVPLVMGLTAASGYANIDVLTFSYDLTGTGPLITGTMTGTLQADNNTFFVNSVGSLTFAGAPAPSTPFVYSFDNFLAGPPLTIPPTVTLDGSYMDIIACTGPSCPDGFLFAAGDNAAISAGGSFYSSGVSFGAAYLPFDAGDWHATVTASATPEPGYAWPLVAGVFALVILRRRRHRRPV
jgi:MYXO-CTERM domain-containing protein